MFTLLLTAGSSAAPLASASGTPSLFQFWFATVVFVITFALVASEKVHKTAAVLVGASLMLLFVLPGEHGSEKPEPVPVAARQIKAQTGTVLQNESASESKAFREEIKKYNMLDPYSKYVNFDVIFTLAGMMVLVNILSKTGLFQYVAIKAVKFAKGYPERTLALLVLATAVLSAFLDNVTTVLLVVPVTFVVASQMKVPSLPFIMAETLASNIGGTATLIGDPPNLIIGSMVGLNFMAFMVNLAPFVLLLLLIYCVILYVYYGRKMKVTVEQRAKIMEMDENSSITDPVTLKKAGTIMLLTIIGFLVHGAFGIQPCVVAMSGAAVCLAVCKVNVDQMLEKIEWGTLFFFLGLFILVEGATYAGLMTKLGGYLSVTASWHPLAIILTVMWLCGISVTVINNVSFTAVAVTIITSFMNNLPGFAGNVELQHLMWWGVALAVCLGGNFTLLGAAANLVVAGLAKQANQDVTFGKFMLYGTPVTLCALTASSLYIAIRYFSM